MTEAAAGVTRAIVAAFFGAHPAADSRRGAIVAARTKTQRFLPRIEAGPVLAFLAVLTPSIAFGQALLRPPAANDDVPAGIESGAAVRVVEGSRGGTILQAAVDAAARDGAASVEVRGEVMHLSEPLAMRPGVAVRCRRGGGLSRAGTIVTFATHGASFASLEGCILDGGWDGREAADYSVAVVNTGTTGTRIAGNKLLNLRGSGISLDGAREFRVEENVLSTTGTVGIGISNATPFEHAGVIRGNILSNQGQHGILTVRASELAVDDNAISDSTTHGMRVDIDGPAEGSIVNLVFGPDFAGIRVGSFIIVNGGLEYHILSKLSNTSLLAKLSSGSPPGRLAGVPASAGTGDMINVQSGAGLSIRRNILRGGVGSSVVVWDDGTHPSSMVTVEGNRSEGAGGAALTTQALGRTSRTSFIGNLVRNPGQNGPAGNPTFNVGLYTQGAPTQTVVGSNAFFDDQPKPTMMWGIAVDDVAPGEITLGGNATMGAANAGVRGAVTAVSIAGWGHEASVSDLAFDGETLAFAVTAKGRNPARTPSLAISHNVTTTGFLPKLALVMEDTTGPVATIRAATPPDAPPTPAVTTLVIPGFTPVPDGRVYRFRGRF